MRAILVLALFLVLASIPTQAQPAQPRLLVFGDSIGYGLAVSDTSRAYRHMLANAIGASLTFTRTTTIGDIPAQLPAAEYAVLEVGLNDATLGLMPEDEWPAAYGATLDRLQATGAIVVAATPFHALSKASPHYATVERYAAYIRAEAAARNIAVADLWALADCSCISQPDEPSVFPPLYHGDGFHPNDTGHAFIASTMVRALLPYGVYAPMTFSARET